MQLHSLQHTLERLRNSLHGITFVEGSNKESFLSYSDLYKNSLQILYHFQQRGIKPKHELVLQIEEEQLFIAVFWACIMGAIIPVPLAIGRTDDHKVKLFNVLKQLDNPWLIASDKNLDKIRNFSVQNNLRSNWNKVETSSIELYGVTTGTSLGKVEEAANDDIAYIQFSSGSTGDPKGVRLTHTNLLTNAGDILSGINAPPSGDTFFSWMPLTHDMGLIGFHLAPVLAGWNHFIMSTELFIKRPALWLQKIAEHKISFTASPNFGYKYVLSRLNKEQDLKDLSLSSLRIITNGAEPISYDLCRRFVSELAPWGLKENVIFPVYGLAEASLAVTFSKPGDTLKRIAVERDQLNIGDKVRIVTTETNALSFVNVGCPVEHCRLRIVDNTGSVVPENVVGKIQIKGGNVTSGYYNNPVATSNLITEDGWLQTGDLGFCVDNDLFVVGRTKDVIFVNGKNLYAHDLETTIELRGLVEPGKIAIAACRKDVDAAEEMIVAFIVHKGPLDSFLPVVKAIKEEINSFFGFTIDHVYPVKQLPKTTSGKVQRFKLVSDYAAGEFEETEKLLKQSSQNHPVESTDVKVGRVESRLLDLWRDLLKNEYLTIDSDFFHVGGNSLLAAETIAVVNADFHVEISFSDFFELRTIRSLTAFIKNAPGSEEHLDVPKQTHSVSEYPLSLLQKGIYYTWATHPNATAYNIPCAFRMRGNVDVAKLNDACKKVLNRHDSLRTYIQLKNDVPVQRVQPKVSFEIDFIESTLSELEECIQSLIKPFDLHKAPLFRASLIRIAADDFILFMDVHHSVADGQSIQIILNDVLSFYSGIEPKPLHQRYADFVLREQHDQYAIQQKENRAYWQKQFEEGVPQLELPTDFNRPLIFTYSGKRKSFLLDATSADRLRAIAARREVTLPTLLLASYYVLLSCYTNQTSITVGIPVHGRSDVSAKDLVGMFVNNIALKCHVAGEQSFESFLHAVRDQLYKAYDHQDYPFAWVAEAMAGVRDMSRNSIFDTAFLYQNFNQDIQQPGDFNISKHYFDPQYSKYDLTIEIFEEAGSLSIYFEYATDLFSDETIEKLGSHFLELLNKTEQNFSKSISQLSVLSESEYRNEVYACNETAVLNHPRSEKTVVELFEWQAKETPENIAIVFGDKNITYEALDSWSNSIANKLCKEIACLHAPVIMLLDRTPEFIAAAWAIMKSGACFIPVDPQFPEERIKLLIDNSQADRIVTGSDELARMPFLKAKYATKLILVEEIPTTYVANETGAQVTLHDTAYVLYTSGTTGVPKGVMVSHTGLANYITWAEATYFQEQPCVMPLFTSVSFDLTITSYIAPLVSGNTVVVYPENSTSFPLESVLADNLVNLIKLTPSHLKLLPTIWKRTNTTESKIRTIIVGGENLDQALACEIYNLFAQRVTIFNEYGPTEATVGCMIKKFDPESKRSSVAIGVPIWNTQIYILNKFLQPVPVGVQGELYISGQGLATGYLNKPVLTAQRFVPNPFIANARMYQSGDAAKRSRSGEITFLGRVDRQVKVNGYRVEIQEVEQILSQHTHIDEAVVLSRSDANGTMLVAYYRTSDSAASTNSIRKFLAERMPHYMIPKEFILVDTFPLNGIGKIDYAKLSQVKQATEAKQETVTGNAIEKLLVEAWEKYLGHADIGTLDNYFELGGDSIKAVQISSFMNEKGYELKPKDILTYHTIEQIAFCVEQSHRVNTEEQKPIEGNKTWTPIDEWFFQQNFSNPNYYNQSVLLRFNRPLDVTKLTTVFRRLLHHHDAFRLNYHAETAELYFNTRLDTNDFEIKNIDAAGESEDQVVEKLRHAGKELKQSMSIENGFLMRVAVFNSTSLGNFVLITAHHLAIDGVSWRILLEDLYNLYGDMAIDLPSKTTSIQRYASTLENLLAGRMSSTGNDVSTHEDYFVFPDDMDTADWRTRNENSVAIEFTKEETNQLVDPEMHKAYKTDVSILLLIALVRTLQDKTGASHISLEVEDSGRNNTELNVSRTIGWFTTIYNLHAHGSKDGSSLHDLLVSVKEQVRSARKNFVNTKGARAEVRFNYLGHFTDQMVNNDLFAYSLIDTGPDMDEQNDMTSKLDINCFIFQDKLNMTIAYNARAHRYDSIEEIKNLYQQNLTELVFFLQGKTEVHHSPSDFQLAIDSEDLKELFG